MKTTVCQILPLLVLTVGVTFPGSAQIPERYDLVDLADMLPLRGVPSSAVAVSHAGHVAGSYTDVSKHLRAVIWERTGPSTWRPIDLAQETGFGSLWSEARDVNDRGEVVGYFAKSSSAARQAVRWFRDSSGRWQADRLGDGEIRSLNNDTEFARNLSNGAIALYSWRAPPGFSPRFRFNGGANGINDAGMFVGILYTSAAPAAFLSRIDRFPLTERLPGSTTSEAVAINQPGRIVGTIQGTGTKGRAAVWQRDGTQWKLVSLHPVGAAFSRANSINDLSHVVGWAVVGTQQGFLYDCHEGRTIALASRVTTPGWAVEEPLDINNAGEIVGVGLNRGVRKAFLLKPVRAYSFAHFGMQPNAVNNRGQVAGFEPGVGAWVWDQNRLAPIGGAITRLWDINDDYRVVGELQAGSNATVWTMTDPAGARSWIPTTLAGPQGGTAAASGVSNANVAVGISAFESVVWPVDAIPAATAISPTYDIRHGCTPMGTGNNLMRINPGGFAAGNCLTDGGSTVLNNAASWSPRYGLMLVATPGAIGVASFAKGINNSGVIVGSYETGTVSQKQAYVFDRRSAATRRLPSLSGILLDTDANAINSRGVVVGFSVKDGRPRAVRWNEQGQIEDLNTLLSPVDSAQWSLINALGINDAGQIAGNAVPAGGSNLVGFLLTLPN